MREISPYDKIVKAEFEYKYIGMAMGHNYLCAVCKFNSAVQDCSVGILQPCWDCQKRYMLRKVRWFDKFIYKGE